MKKAPPDRIVFTTLLIGPLCLLALLPTMLTCFNYFSSDEVLLWMIFLIIIATFVLGYSFDFVIEHVVMKRALYGDQAGA